MAFTLETGSGVTGANAYVDTTFADTHHSDRNNTRWSDFTVTEKRAAIIRATEFVDKRFGRRFRGMRKSKDQGLEWPRLSAFDDDGFLLSGVDDLPRQLEKAVAEYALRAAILGVLAPDPTLPVPGQNLESGAAAREEAITSGQVTLKRERVDVLEEETRYETPSQTLAKNLAAAATGVKSSLVSDFYIPEYPEADMWLEELLESSMSALRMVRA